MIDFLFETTRYVNANRGSEGINFVELNVRVAAAEDTPNGAIFYMLHAIPYKQFSVIRT